MNYKSKFCERFKRAVQESGLTLKELSETTDISMTPLRRYTSDRVPKARALFKICMALHVSADYLLGLSDER